MTKYFRTLALGVAASALLAACSGNDEPAPAISGTDSTVVDGATTDGGDYAGFYLLNEGNMGANKCTLDYYDYATGTYQRNVYAQNNPEVVLDLGDAGNHMAIYRDRLFIVVTGSHKVEVLDARTARRIGQVNISSPRCIAFAGDKAFVTSSVGSDDGKGSVVRFDIATLAVDGTALAGLNPEGIVEHKGMLYVANSYNYGIGAFDDKVSVIDPATMKTEYMAQGRVNMRSLLFDSYDNLWAISSGNYAEHEPGLNCMEKRDGKYADAGTVLLSASSMTIYKDKIYTVGVAYDANWNSTPDYYGIRTAPSFREISAGAFVWDGATLQTPYYIAVNPSIGEFYITDARNYTSSGAVYAFGADRQLRWKATTGDIPAAIAFLPK